jgi:hypothetical protein
VSRICEELQLNQNKTVQLKKRQREWVQWLAPVISATWEVEIRRIMLQDWVDQDLKPAQAKD